MMESMYDQVTLYGFYNVFPEILTGLDLPEGIDEEMVRYTILDNAGMMFPYHQAMPYLTISIHNWFKQNKDNFTRILLALNKDYNPIENYDRREDRTLGRTENTTEEHSENQTGNHSEQKNDYMSGSVSGNITATSNSTSGNEQTNQRAADNSESWRNTDKNFGQATSNGTNTTITGGSNSQNTTGTVTGSDTTGITGNRTGGTSENVVESLHVHGNIGVTTNQQMIQAELDLRTYNIYEDICNRFVDKFLIGVYD